MGLTIEFTQKGNGRYFTRSGWSGPEAGFTWSKEERASLLLPLSDWHGGYRCKIGLLPYTKPPFILTQELIVTVRDIEVFRETLTGTNWIEIAFDIPESALTGRDILELDFALPSATAPMLFGDSVDARKLAIAIHKLVLEERKVEGGPESGGVHRLSAATPMGPPVKVAAVCMTYNEPEFLPLWLSHYERQVGRENCFVIDDGTSDGSTERPDIRSIVRLPRRPYDPALQTAFNTQFCAALLHYYDYVLYTDVDEFVVPDPKIAKNLAEFCRYPLPPVVTMIGLDVVHLSGEEPPWTPDQPVLVQRRFVRFASAMCKATLIRHPVVWAPGSHSANARTLFTHLYLFHTKWFDLPTSLARLKRTREMAWASSLARGISRAEDEAMLGAFRHYGAMPRITGADFDPEAPPIESAIAKVLASMPKMEGAAYKIALDIWGEELWEVPERFRQCF